jgi:uncharacterized membrane protein
MNRCTAIKPDGQQCGASAIENSDRCWNHHPKYAEARKRKASKGGRRAGRGRPQVETAAIKGLLEDLTQQVLSGELSTNVAAVANQLINTRLRAIEQERKIKETEELEARLTELEEALEANAQAKPGRYG